MLTIFKNISLIVVAFTSYCSLYSQGDIRIGYQTWMKKNLDTETFRNGDPIPEIKNKEEWVEAGKMGKPAWCYFDNDSRNGKKYGKLYNWWAVNDRRGLAPKGYRIPSDDDWKELIEFLGGSEVAGTKLKSKDFEGTNSSGFSALPGGFRGGNGMFLTIGEAGYFWSSLQFLDNDAWFRVLAYSSSGMSELFANKGSGISIRCIKD